MVKILIVEDSDEEAEELIDRIQGYAHRTGEHFNVRRISSAMEFSAERHPADLVFMDIDLPGLSGMEVAHLLRAYDTSTPLIFVTNLSQYAVRGYEVDALDFIVKPVSAHDLSMCLDKALRIVRRNRRSTIIVPTSDGMCVVDTADVISAEVKNHTVTYRIEGAEKPLVGRGSLTALLERLEGGPFLQVSKSCLVNMEHIASVAGDELRMSDGSVAYLSRSRKRPALVAIAEYLGGTA